MVLLNGHALRLLVAFLDRHFALNPTGLFSAPLTILFILKNADRNAMVLTGCYIPLALAIVVTANCVQSVKKAFPLSNRDKSARCFGLSLLLKRFPQLPSSDRLSRFLRHLQPSDVSLFFGTIGPAATFGGFGCKWYDPKPWWCQ